MIENVLEIMLFDIVIYTNVSINKVEIDAIKNYIQIKKRFYEFLVTII